MTRPKESTRIELGFDGKAINPPLLVTGKVHRITIKAPVLLLNHRYHDDAPVAGAEFEIELEDGSLFRGHLDEYGQAQVKGLRSRPIRVRYGVDPRPYEIVDDGTNPAYIAHFSQADSDTLVTPEGRTRMSDIPDANAFALEAVEWIWGTVKGGFNEKQTVSQIIVDALVGMIPLVGDITAVRDLIAIIIGLAQDPKKRESKLEWLGLVVLLFALIPVFGGAIKGVGKLLLKGVKEAAENSKHLRDMVAFLNRLGMGDALKWLKKLDLESHTGELLGRWRELTHRLDMVLNTILSKLKGVLPPEMLAHIAQLKSRIQELAKKGEAMIPDAVKELNERLKAAQRQLYNGDWHDIPKNLTSKTREVEARLVDVPGGKKWVVDNMHFRPNSRESFFKRDGWPDLSEGRYIEKDAKGKITYKTIANFHGPMRAIRIPGGTRIFRVVERSDQTFGGWWAYALPETGKQWREEFAVLKSYSSDGTYVELIVPPEGLRAWEGNASSQVQNNPKKHPRTEGQYMPGGQTQLFIDFEFDAGKIGTTKEDFVSHIDIKVEKTPWTDDYNSDTFNVPRKSTEADFLGQFELESKNHLPATLIERASRDGQNENEEK